MANLVIDWQCWSKKEGHKDRIHTRGGSNAFDFFRNYGQMVALDDFPFFFKFMKTILGPIEQNSQSYYETQLIQNEFQ